GSSLGVVFSDGVTTTQPVPLAAVTQVIVNGAGGKDTLTLDVGQNLLNTANITSLLPIQFNGAPGPDVLNVLGSAAGGTAVTETFTLGTGSSASTLALSAGSGAAAKGLITVTLTGPTAIVDSLSGTSFVFNGNAENNLIHIQSQSRGPAAFLVIKGINAQDNG